MSLSVACSTAGSRPSAAPNLGRDAGRGGPRETFRRYGKGRHPAGLNFGDVFAYALAKATGEPLLFRAGDFGRTDIDVA